MSSLAPGAGPQHASCALSRDLFLRALGVVYLTAFLSLAWQVRGLLGTDGLEPAADFLGAVRHELGAEASLRVPTIFWLDASDAALRGACLAGAFAAGLVVLGLVPLSALLACWGLYLSLVGVGGDFLLYQWDALLLETGFLAVFWAPATLRLGSPGGRARAPSTAVLWLLRWLVFRLMFFSGWVKLASDDPAWWNLTALGYHYWSQPLPAWTSWYAAQLPGWLQKLSCAVMFAIELALPPAILLGRRARAVACAGFVALQALIAATGNYGFFNLLAAALCIPLLDDRHLAWLAAALPRGARPRVPAAAAGEPPGSPWRAPGGAPARAWRRARDAVLAALILALSLPLALGQLGVLRRGFLPPTLTRAIATLQPLRLVGTYGLFAIMTTDRPEIVVEGSDDGETWQPYVFRWKPGPLDRAPGFVEPDMPRLDWQMWFDALYVERLLDGLRMGREMITPLLIERLLDGSAPVRRLLLADPFAGAAPRQVRWQLYEYRFTDAAERAATGAWWKRKLIYESRVFAQPDPDAGG